MRRQRGGSPAAADSLGPGPSPSPAPASPDGAMRGPSRALWLLLALRTGEAPP